MSGCWCKCEAGLGQCGPKVPRLKSLFGAHKQTDEASLRRGDRQAELQIIWEALEEAVRRKTALEENVLSSEKRLMEILGPESVKVVAPPQLPLQTRLDMNMARLHELDSERLGAYGWVGGLVVMVELRHRVMLLRETLKLPPCDPLADLDKVLVNTMEALSSLCPGKLAILPACEASGEEQKPVLQRLQRFYQALRAIESTWVESFAQKDGEGLHDHMEKAAQVRLRNIEEKRNARKRTRDVQRQKSESAVGPSILNSESAVKSQGSKNKIIRSNTQSTEESESLQLLSQNIISKLDTLNQQFKLKIRSTEEAPSSPSMQDRNIPLSETLRLAEQAQAPDRPGPELQQTLNSWPVSVPGKSVRTPTSVRTRAANPATNCPSSMLLEREAHHPAETPVEVAGVPRADLLPCTAREAQSLGKMKPSDLFGVRNSSVSVLKIPRKSPSREPLRTLPNSTGMLVSSGSQGLKKLGPPVPPPPPPPPMPPSGSSILLLKKQSKLKRSVKISRLYRSLKTKIEGAAHVHSTTGLASSSRRLSTSGTREGMAEALAEITKKSTYFQKIEDDVLKFRDLIEESKLALEDFKTTDMQQLMCFHNKLESLLEKLTDETQVLARFKGFPSNKLETVRLAAALYSRLLSMATDLEKWEVQAPAVEHLEKVIRYFEKVKKELEMVEGSKDEDFKRFTNQKITFDFTILGRIKEAMVGLSSRCLVQALEESQRNKTGCPDRQSQGCDSSRQRLCSQMLWRTFQLAYRVYNFAGGHDDQSERLISEIAAEIDSFPADVWS